MSRSVKTDRPFEVERFIEYLKLAKGNRTSLQYAEDCDVTPQYLSRCFNGKFTAPPLPATLKRLAAYAANDITYEMFLDAAGYSVEKYSKEAAKEKLTAERAKEKARRFDQLATATIAASLARSGERWTMDYGVDLREDNQTLNYLDLQVSIKDCPISHWYFAYIPDLNESPSEREEVTSSLSLRYGMITLALHTDDMITFVTNSALVYDIFSKNPPRALATHVSVALINTKDLTITKTQILETAAPQDIALPELK